MPHGRRAMGRRSVVVNDATMVNADGVRSRYHTRVEHLLGGYTHHIRNGGRGMGHHIPGLRIRT